MFHISALARKHLAVEVSSAASERKFSVGGLVVTKTHIYGGTMRDLVFASTKA